MAARVLRRVLLATSLCLATSAVAWIAGAAVAEDVLRFSDRFPLPTETGTTPSQGVRNIASAPGNPAPNDARAPIGEVGLYVSSLPLERFLARTEGGVQRWSTVATRAAEASGIPSDFFIRLLSQESGFRPTAVSRAGAQGIAQFMPATAIAVGLKDPFDPEAAIRASADHLATLVKRFGNVGLAAAAYNAGSERVRIWLAGRKGLPLETRDYVRRITGLEAENWAGPRAALLPPVAEQSSPAHRAKVVNGSGTSRRGGAAASLCGAINARGGICRVQASY